MGDLEGVSEAVVGELGTLVGAEAAGTRVSGIEEEVLEAGAAFLPCASTEAEDDNAEVAGVP